MNDLCRILDVLCPMHVALDCEGRIRHAGPTLRKLRAGRDLTDANFLDVFEVCRPRAVTEIDGLMASHEVKLHLRFRDAPATTLKGLLVPAGALGGAVINLSFGISILEGVREYDLSSADFPSTDLTIEMLYLFEAKSAAMEASRKLNLRLQGAKIAAEEQAFTDTLTGLKNRRAMDHVLPRLAESGQTFTLMQVDLDFFKTVNDTLGHAAGDHVLQYVARVLVDETRSEDTVVRIGGDEFVLLFSGLCDQGQLAEIARRIIERLTRPIPFESETCRISASIGISVWGGGGCADPGQLLAEADLALYASKNKGRGRHSFYEPGMTAPAGAARSERRGGGSA